MNKGAVAFVSLLLIVLVIWFLSTRGAPHQTVPVTTTNIPKTTAPNTSTTSNTPKTTNTLVNTTNTIVTPYVPVPCNNFILNNSVNNSTAIGQCGWNGGVLGVWVAAGKSGNAKVTIEGTNNKIYVEQNFTYGCVGFLRNFTAPPQEYTIIMVTGKSTGTCGTPFVKLNTTTVPPLPTYGYIYNGNFSNGNYSGWTLTNPGFGKAPLNISYANKNTCYIGNPWKNYVGAYFATTFNCGISNSPGNLTSNPFIVEKPFLNFRIISPYDNGIYVEILYNGTPYVVARYNTFNTTLGSNASSTFRNASIPLITLIGKKVQIKVVANTLHRENYIAVGDFSLANKPNSQEGILVNMTVR